MSANFRTRLVERLNAKAPDSQHHISYEGPRPFGGDTIHSYRLGNGLTVMLLKDDSAPVATYFTWFNVGSRHETAGKTGLAHLFEHLMFNETESLKAGEFDRLLEESGAESNAATWVDWTFYHESIPADRIGLAVRLEANRMANLVLREPQLVSEKEVVTNERRQRVDDDIEGAANELLYKTAFTCHPYHWPTIGWMSDIEGFTTDDCERFYKTYYAPNNATVVVVGDFNEGSLLTKIQSAYGSIPSSVIPEEDTHPEPPQTEERTLVVHKPTETEKLLVGFHGPALGDADHAPLSLLNEVLFGGRASRVYNELITEKELASDLRGWVSTFRDPGLYDIFAAARTGRNGAEILDVLDGHFSRVKSELVSEVELARAKARLELSLLQSLDTMSGKAEQIGFYWTVLGDPAFAFQRLEAYRRVTRGDLRRVARRYLNSSSRTVLRVLPDEAGDAVVEGAA